MNQLDLFNSNRSTAAKQTGMDRAASAKPDLLALARRIALALASNGRHITADDVVEELVKRGHDIHCLGNSAGSLFKEKHWVQCGLRKSTRVHAHSNLLRVWKLK